MTVADIETPQKMPKLTYGDGSGSSDTSYQLDNINEVAEEENGRNLFDQLSIGDMDFTKSGLFSKQPPIEPIPGILPKPQAELMPSNISNFLEDFDMQFEKSSLFGKENTSGPEGVSAAEQLQVTENQDQASRYNSDMSLIGAEFIASLSNGKKVRLARKLNKSRAEDLSADSERNYYGVAIHELLQNIEENSKWTELKRQDERLNGEASKVPNVSLVKTEQLLAEKFRPKKWIDLLGSERTHRSMMNWLVKWSKVVFDGDMNLLTTYGYDTDALGRPQKKILLVHGPPGIGKTTVAHIIAKQAGYDIMEINASDERSGSVVQNRIQNAVESHRIAQKGASKPVCIIADEIEGATENGFVHSLLNMIHSDQQELANLTTNHGEVKKKRKSKSKLLLRPIIAICNDVYTPSLRQLRPYAEVVQYSKSDTRSVITRLRDVCSKEKIGLSAKQLTEIAQAANGDLRTCFNMIQFGVSSGEEVFEKDLSRSWSRVSNRMFKKPDNDSTKKGAWEVLLSEIDGAAEYDKIINGCFTLYPHVRYNDDMVRKPGMIGDWLDFYEHACSGIYQAQQGSLTEYLAHPIQAFNLLFGSSVNVKDQKIESESYEASERLKETKELVKDYFSECSPTLRQLFNKTEVLLELLPYSVSICSPLIESSAVTLRSHEKNKISNAGQAFIGTGVRLIKERLENGSLVYRMDPPIEKLAVVGSGQSQDLVAVGKYTVRTLIQDYIIAEKGAEHANKRKFEYSRAANVKSSSKKLKRNLHDGTAVATKLKAGPKDFFGRPMFDSDNPLDTKTDSVSGTDMTASETSKHERLWIQYVEGFSNAVRKDLTWADFWMRQ